MQESKLRVVVADDHQPVHDLVRRILEPEFEVVRTVSDGKQLLEAVAELEPDAIVTDISMPGMSGLDALRRLNREESQPPSVVLTAHNEPRLIARALESGAMAYVIKRRAPIDLCEALRAAVDGRRYVSEGLKTLDPQRRSIFGSMRCMQLVWAG